jgi:hypothetical protein
MGSLPFCWSTIQRVRCPHGPYFKAVTGYPEDPKTIGEQIRKRRLDLGIRQNDAARIIGCNEYVDCELRKGTHPAAQQSHAGRSGHSSASIPTYQRPAAISGEFRAT